MGDRTTTYFPCPKCGKEVEQYDAPSSLIYSCYCENCDWRDDSNYYETDNNTIELLTPEQAKARGLVGE